MMRNVPSASSRCDPPSHEGRSAVRRRQRRTQTCLQLVFEQAFDHGGVLLDLEPNARSASPAAAADQQQGAFERSIPFGEPRQPSLRDPRTSHRIADVRGRHGTVAPPLPFREELEEHFVDELAALLRRHPRFLVALLGELQDVGREILERALEISLHVADGVCLRLLRTSKAVKPRIVAGPIPPQLQPRPGGFAGQPPPRLART